MSKTLSIDNIKLFLITYPFQLHLFFYQHLPVTAYFPLHTGAFTFPKNENNSSYVLISGRIFKCFILTNMCTARSGWSCGFNATWFWLDGESQRPINPNRICNLALVNFSWILTQLTFDGECLLVWIVYEMRWF